MESQLPRRLFSQNVSLNLVSYSYIIPVDMIKKTSAFSTPILILEFNRPDYLLKTIEILRKISATDIYIHVDGPRQDNTAEQQASMQIQAYTKLIDWKCKVHTNFMTKHVGCKEGVSQGISWFFNKVSEGIILEDDCMPDISFFPYAEELLEKYRLDERVGMIAGNTFFNDLSCKTSYSFSIHPHCWGWGTWRRAWTKYDVTMSDFGKNGKEVVDDKFTSLKSRRYWMSIFTQTFIGNIDTWDYQWTYLSWKLNMFCVVPAINLVTNIGFDSRATHTKFAFSPIAFQKKYKMTFPLIHPKNVNPDLEMDHRIQGIIFEQNIVQKLLLGLKNYLKRLFIQNARITS